MSLVGQDINPLGDKEFSWPITMRKSCLLQLDYLVVIYFDQKNLNYNLVLSNIFQL